MTLWVLDTDHVTLHQQAHPLIVQRIAAIGPHNLAVTIISAEEQFRGRLNIIRRYGTSIKQVQAYGMLRATINYFRQSNTLNFDKTAHTQYEALRQQNIRIGTQDLRIAAIMLSVRGILVTRNQRDFMQVPGLTFQDWTLP